MYSGKELQQLHDAGQAFKTGTGTIVPTATGGDVVAAVARAKGAEGTGYSEDDPAFRAHVAARAAAHGMQSLVPHSWAAGDQAVKGLGRNPSAADIRRFLAEDALMRSVQPRGRAALAAARSAAAMKAAEYRNLARYVSDQALSDSYAQLARETLARAGITSS
jgi:hypothetical protein